MKITILTLFPEMFTGFLTNSIIKRAIAKEIVEVEVINIRDYTKDKYHRVDSGRSLINCIEDSDDKKISQIPEQVLTGSRKPKLYRFKIRYDFCA